MKNYIFKPHAPIVGTGNEFKIAHDSGMAIVYEEVRGQAVLGRQFHHTTPWLTEQNGQEK